MLLGEKQPSHDASSTPEQIGALAVFLCRDAAAPITGAACRSTAAGPRSSAPGAPTGSGQSKP